MEYPSSQPALSDAILVEVALDLLSDNDIDDLSDVAGTLSKRTGISKRELEKLGQQAAADPAALRGAIRALLEDVAANKEGAVIVAEAEEHAGKKQFVPGVNELVLVGLLMSGFVSGYIAVKRGGKTLEVTETEQTTSKDGTTTTKAKKSTTYADPTSGIGKLMEALISKIGGTAGT